MSYRNRLVELSEKFFGEEVLELIVSQTIFYATSKGDIGFTVAVEEICVFFRIVDSAKLNSRKKSLRFIRRVTAFHLSVVGHQVYSPPNLEKHMLWTMYALIKRSIIWSKLKIINTKDALVKIARKHISQCSKCNVGLCLNCNLCFHTK